MPAWNGAALGGAPAFNGRVGDGAATTPAYSFGNYATTGFYAATGPELYAAVSGTAIARWTSSGFIVLSGALFADNLQATSGTTTPVLITGGVRLAERTDPSAPAANSCTLYAKDNGAGKTQLMVLFASGDPIEIAIEV